MLLDDIINNPLKLHKKSSTPGFRKFIRIIKRGEYNPRNLWQTCMKEKAIKAGLIDEDLNILKEV